MTSSPNNPMVLFLVDNPEGVDNDKPRELLINVIQFFGFRSYDIQNLRYREALPSLEELERTIANAQPHLIVSVGGAASQLLLGSTRKISELRGTVYRRNNALVVPTLSPAYVLKQPSQLGKFLTDIRMVYILSKKMKEGTK